MTSPTRQLYSLPKPQPSALDNGDRPSPPTSHAGPPELSYTLSASRRQSVARGDRYSGSIMR